MNNLMEEDGESTSLSIVIPLIIANLETTNLETNEEDEPQQPRMHTLQDLCKLLKRYIFCLFSNLKNITFEDVFQEEKWQIVMDEEIGPIKCNNTWELSYLPKGA